jgi:hypothetical protein
MVEWFRWFVTGLSCMNVTEQVANLLRHEWIVAKESRGKVEIDEFVGCVYIDNYEVDCGAW